MAHFWTSTAAEREARKVPCACADHGCSTHVGHDCSVRVDPRDDDGSMTLFRVDMADDWTGTLFCEACASDALNSGLFATLEDVHELDGGF